MDAILPEDSLDEVPSSFQAVGHVGMKRLLLFCLGLTRVAHLNLRSQYLPYKSLIATVLLDKNTNIKTVINKTDTVGEESEYRTFNYEVLAGPHDMDVTAREQGCVFKFNYAKVYWNSRLNTEHERLVELFRPGEAICDVMAGIGPFAIPSGRKHTFVWANDLNPDSFKYLEQNIKINRVEQFVQAFNMDGRVFIEQATKDLFMSDRTVTLPLRKVSRSAKEKPAATQIQQPKTFSHFAMNLPASAITFLPAFIGLYARVGIPKSEKLPCIHVYCFIKKLDGNVDEAEEINKTISNLLGFSFILGDVGKEGQLKVTDVRDVGPNKRMFCASFILPTDVAYRNTQS
jgi:tRNA (guanine37-N1)-methyltransferase